MKKTIAAVIIIASIATGLALAQPMAQKYWQDFIMQPDQAWKESYGKTDDSQLAYNVSKLIGAVKAQAGAIGLLKGEIASLKVELDGVRADILAEKLTIDEVDPNE